MEAFDEFVREFEQECLNEDQSYLFEVGWEAYRIFQERKAYQDQTGNLSSSVGFAVVKDGEIWREGGFKTTANGEEGRQAGKALVREVKGNIGLELIFVAGTHYASFVEAKGYDVNTAAELLIDELI